MPVRECIRDFIWLLPPSLEELIPETHPVRFIAEFVDGLDLAKVGIEWKPADEGAASYDRHMLLGCWLYGFMVHIRSSRKIETACGEIVNFMWLTGMQRPDHSTLSRFYKQNRKSIRKLLKKTVHLATEMGLVDFAVQAIDGSKIGSVTVDGRVGRKKIEELLVKVDAEIAAMERGIDQEDQGQPVRPKMAKELGCKKELRERIKQALAKVEELEGKADKATGEPKSGDGKVEKSEGDGKAEKAKDADQVEKAKGAGKEEKKPKVSVADPEAVMMKARHGNALGHNAQAAVDSKARIIVAADVFDSVTDHGQLVPMLEETKENTGRLADKTVTDGGYYSGDNLEAVQGYATEVFMPDPQEKRKSDNPNKWPYHKDKFVYEPETDTYRCPEGKPLTFSHTTCRSDEGGKEVKVYRGRECSGCPAWGKGGCTKDKKGRTIEINGHEGRIREHRQKMQTEEARALIKQRSGTVELVFAVIKEQMGVSRFLLRGLENARAEWQLACAVYNLWRIWKEVWIKQGKAHRGLCQRAA